MQTDPKNERPGEIGLIVRGSLSDGLTMKLAPETSVESLRAGKFVVVDGEQQLFFSLVTDVALATTDSRLMVDPPGRGDAVMRRILAGVNAYGQVTLRPMLMLTKPEGGDGHGEVSPDDLRPVKTIPSHFCPVHEATEEDVANIFGSESRGDGKYFHIGQPLDMETPVCLNLERFVERSSGIFGKSGTGKTFLTRICLCGMLKSARDTVHLIFDMHSEYGWQGKSEGDRANVRGLKQYFPGQVEIFALDPKSAVRRGVRPDFEVRIPYSQIEPEDILLLASELNLPATAADTTFQLQNAFKNRWLEKFLAMDSTAVSEFALQNNGNVSALSALQRRLERMAGACQEFLKPSLPAEDDAVSAILRRLERGISVVLEFGQQDSTLSYMLVANILTRRIHAEYVHKMESAQGEKNREPKHLVITIEEAHKFLSPHLSGQTIFGTIARELRKYKVTLLIVDQRPSGIDDEVLSQVGTCITCLLNDEKDIEAVLTGVSGAKQLRGVLATLDSKQQALVLGHAVPMPVVIKTRTYDDDAFRQAMGGYRIASAQSLFQTGGLGNGSEDTIPDSILFGKSDISDAATLSEVEQRKKMVELDFG